MKFLFKLFKLKMSSLVSSSVCSLAIVLLKIWYTLYGTGQIDPNWIH